MHLSLRSLTVTYLDPKIALQYLREEREARTTMVTIRKHVNQKQGLSFTSVLKKSTTVGLRVAWPKA
jgi:hypothetical protein